MVYLFRELQHRPEFGELVEKVFTQFDSNGVGYLTCQQFSGIMKRSGFITDATQVGDYFREVGVNVIDNVHNEDFRNYIWKCVC
jgi:hypothetical protein